MTHEVQREDKDVKGPALCGTQYSLFNHTSKHEIVINNKVYVKHVALGPRGSPLKGHVWSGFTKCESRFVFFSAGPRRYRTVRNVSHDDVFIIKM